MKLNTILQSAIAFAILGAAVVTPAQRGGFGFGGGQAPDAFLLRRADVQRDLGVTTDQKADLDKMQQDMFANMRGRRNGGGGAGGGGGFGGGGGTPPTPEQQAERQKQMEDMMKAIDEKIATILKPEQVKRLHEIGIQLAKNRAISRPDVQKALALTDEQKAKVAELTKAAGAANQEIRTKVRNEEISREDSQALIQKNNDALEAELGKVLTADQAAKLKDLGGAEFKADEQPQGFGGGGGGR